MPASFKGWTKPYKTRLEGRLTSVQYGFFKGLGFPVKTTSYIRCFNEQMLLMNLGDGYSKVISTRVQRDWRTYVSRLNQAKGYAS